MTDREYNYVINSQYSDEIDKRLLRTYLFNETEVIKELEGNVTIYDVLVDCGIFKSKNDAKRNWKCGPLRDGFNDFKDIGKLHKRLTVMVYGLSPRIEA